MERTTLHGHVGTGRLFSRWFLCNLKRSFGGRAGRSGMVFPAEYAQAISGPTLTLDLRWGGARSKLLTAHSMRRPFEESRVNYRPMCILRRVPAVGSNAMCLNPMLLRRKTSNFTDLLNKSKTSHTGGYLCQNRVLNDLRCHFRRAQLRCSSASYSASRPRDVGQATFASAAESNIGDVNGSTPRPALLKVQTNGDSDNHMTRPTLPQLRRHFLAAMLPMVGFGFMDNVIMLQAGEAVDASLGVTFGLSTLTAAAVGQIFSDVSGVCFGGVIATVAIKLGFTSTMGLNLAQQQTQQARFVATAGRIIGVILGCLLGMSSLVFMELEESTRLRRLKDLQPVLENVIRQSKKSLQAASCHIYLVNSDSDTGELDFIEIGTTQNMVKKMSNNVPAHTSGAESSLVSYERCSPTSKVTALNNMDCEYFNKRLHIEEERLKDKLHRLLLWLEHTMSSVSYAISSLIAFHTRENEENFHAALLWGPSVAAITPMSFEWRRNCGAGFESLNSEYSKERKDDITNMTNPGWQYVTYLTKDNREPSSFSTRGVWSWQNTLLRDRVFTSGLVYSLADYGKRIGIVSSSLSAPSRTPHQYTVGNLERYWIGAKQIIFSTAETVWKGMTFVSRTCLSDTDLVSTDTDTGSDTPESEPFGICHRLSASVLGLFFSTASKNPSATGCASLRCHNTSTSVCSVVAYVAKTGHPVLFLEEKHNGDECHEKKLWVATDAEVAQVSLLPTVNNYEETKFQNVLRTQQNVKVQPSCASHLENKDLQRTGSCCMETTQSDLMGAVLDPPVEASTSDCKHCILWYPIFESTSAGRVVGVIQVADKLTSDTVTDLQRRSGYSCRGPSIVHMFTREDERLVRMLSEHVALYLALGSRRVNEDSYSYDCSQDASLPLDRLRWVCPPSTLSAAKLMDCQ